MYRGNYFSSRSVERSGLARRLRNRLPVIIAQPKGLSRKKRRSEKFRAIFPQKTKKRRNGRALTVSAFVCAPSRREKARRRRLFAGFFGVIRPTFRRLFGGFFSVIRPSFRRALDGFFVGYSADFSPDSRPKRRFRSYRVIRLHSIKRFPLGRAFFRDV